MAPKHIPWQTIMRYQRSHYQMVGEIIVVVNEIEYLLDVILSNHKSYKFKKRKPFTFGEKKSVVLEIINALKKDKLNTVLMKTLNERLDYFNQLRNDCAHSRVNYTGEMYRFNKNKTKGILLIRNGRSTTYTAEQHNKNIMSTQNLNYLLCFKLFPECFPNSGT